MRENLLERVLKTVRNYDMLKSDDRVLVAVSGGPDSVFLLYAIHSLKNKFKLQKISICNLDHGIRGKESAEDSLSVKRLAKGIGLEFIHKKVSMKALAVKGLSTEEIARQARYKFFHEAASHAGANVIATGHTLDDQAETVLMRVIKGASLKGVIGISPVREEKSIRIIRPLIEIEKSEILRYLDREGIPYRIDRTNAEPIYFRNVVRSRIVPFLEKYNPRLKRALFSLAEHLREDYQFIEEAKRSVKVSKCQGVKVELKDIIRQPKAIQKEILRDLLEEAGGEVKRLSFRHWKELENLISRKGKGSSVDLPGSIRVLRDGRALVFSRI